MSDGPTQAEADRLLAMEKRRKDNTVHYFPSAGDSLRVPLVSVDKTEEFSLDIQRSQIVLRKITYQTRWESVVILLRLDIEGAPHRNPDGTEVPCPHLHVYREGYADKWARQIRPGEFPQMHDLGAICGDFMRHCAVVDPPEIHLTLFS